MPTASMIAAARTLPMPGRASRSSETRMRAIASSVPPESSTSAMVRSPDLSRSLAVALDALAAAAFFSASARSWADKGRKVTVIPRR
ncbi:hypothetical protein D9M69_712560 [compost metagenome]